MILFAVAALINGFFAIAIGLFGYLRNPKSTIYATFGALNLVAALWSFSYFGWQMSQVMGSESGSLLWSRILAIFATLIPVLYVHWTLSFLGKDKAQKGVLYCFYILTAIFLVISFTPYYVISVKSIAGFSYWPQGGTAYALYVILLYVGMNGYGLIHLLSNYNKTHGLKKTQIKYLLIGAAFAFGGGDF